MKRNSSEDGGNCKPKRRKMERRWMTIKCTLKRFCTSIRVWKEIDLRVEMSTKIVFYGSITIDYWAAITSARCWVNGEAFTEISGTLVDRFFHAFGDPTAVDRKYTPRLELYKRDRSKKGDKHTATMRQESKEEKKWRSKKGKEKEEEEKEEKKREEKDEKEGKRQSKKGSEKKIEIDEKGREKRSDAEIAESKQKHAEVANSITSFKSFWKKYMLPLKPPVIGGEGHMRVKFELEALRQQYLTNARMQVAHVGRRTFQWIQMRLAEFLLDKKLPYPKQRSRYFYETCRRVRCYLINGTTSIPLSSDIKLPLLHVMWIKKIAAEILTLFARIGIERMDRDTIKNKWWLFIPWLYKIREDRAIRAKLFMAKEPGKKRRKRWRKRGEQT